MDVDGAQTSFSNQLRNVRDVLVTWVTDNYQYAWLVLIGAIVLYTLRPQIEALVESWRRKLKGGGWHSDGSTPLQMRDDELARQRQAMIQRLDETAELRAAAAERKRREKEKKRRERQKLYERMRREEQESKFNALGGGDGTSGNYRPSNSMRKVGSGGS
jgi:hypothetical protein